MHQPCALPAVRCCALSAQLSQEVLGSVPGQKLGGEGFWEMLCQCMFTLTDITRLVITYQKSPCLQCCHLTYAVVKQAETQNRLLDSALAFRPQPQLAHCELDVIIYILIYITGVQLYPGLLVGVNLQCIHCRGHPARASAHSPVLYCGQPPNNEEPPTLP